MNRDQKAAVVDEIADQIRGAEAIFAVDYRGLSVAQAGELRVALGGADTRFRIVKNSLSERAADQAGAPALKPLLVGPTALALVRGDAALAAKALGDAARRLRLLEFKGGLMNGTALSAEDVQSIARLPARDVLTAQLVGTVAAPLTGLVRGLSALIAGLAIQLQAIADQELVHGEPPPAATPASDASEASEPEEPAALEEPAASKEPAPPEQPAAPKEPAPPEQSAAPKEPEETKEIELDAQDPDASDAQEEPA